MIGLTEAAAASAIMATGLYAEDGDESALEWLAREASDLAATVSQYGATRDVVLTVLGATGSNLLITDGETVDEEAVATILRCLGAPTGEDDRG